MASYQKSESFPKTPGSAQAPWRIAVYIRLSKDDGNDESLSITNQKKIIQEYLETFFSEAFTVTGCYADDGATGTDYDRPAFQKMLRHVEEGQINCIICKNLSRMFRNYSDQGYFLENFFPRHRTRFITVSEPKIDSYLHPEAILGLEVPISGLMNDRFAAKTSRDIRDTFATKRRKGEFIGAFAPYGYEKAPDNKNALVIDPAAAEVVKNIYCWYVQDGMSKSGIARLLNSLGIPSPSAYKRSRGMNFFCPQIEKSDGLWSPRSVSAVLKNQMYTGTMVQGRQTVISYKVHDRISIPEDQWYIVPGTHQPIINESLFEKALMLQQKHTRTAPGKNCLNLLSGFVRCAACKKAMTRQKSKKAVYYYCRTFREKSKDACSKHTIREEDLLHCLLVAIQRQIARLDSLDDIRNAVRRASSQKEKTSGADAALARRKRELDQLTAHTDALYGDWKNGDLTREEYLRLKSGYLSRIRQAEDAIRELEDRQKTEAMGRSRHLIQEDPYTAFFLEQGTIEEINRGILVELVRNIYVHQKGAIEIEFRFSAPRKK